MHKILSIAISNRRTCFLIDMVTSKSPILVSPKKLQTLPGLCVEPLTILHQRWFHQKDTINPLIGKISSMKYDWLLFSSHQFLRWSLGILIFEMLCGFTPFWDGGSPVKIYENILKSKVKYPPYIHHDAQDLLVQLITPDLTKRLGNLHGGPADVKNHAWFAEVTWERLLKKDIDAPYVPPVKGGQGDASQFDKYPEESEEYGKKGDDP